MALNSLSLTVAHYPNRLRSDISSQHLRNICFSARGYAAVVHCIDLKSRELAFASHRSRELWKKRTIYESTAQKMESASLDLVFSCR